VLPLLRPLIILSRDKHGVLLERNFYLGKAAGCRHVDGRNNSINVAAQNWPLLIADYNKRNLSARQILLVTHVFVGRQQKLEARRLRCRYQFAVEEPVPAAFNGFNNDVAFESCSEAERECRYQKV
jgi:hypothetical protein